jgi:hypothetical protein
MKPGQYTGSDGRTLEERISRLEQVNSAALDALIEEEAEEWVEMHSKSFSPRRFSPDGNRAEFWDAPSNRWRSIAIDDGLFQSYRKGREVALEQARELAEAVSALGHIARHENDGIVVLGTAAYDGIKTLAKAVQS